MSTVVGKQFHKTKIYRRERSFKKNVWGKKMDKLTVLFFTSTRTFGIGWLLFSTVLFNKTFVTDQTIVFVQSQLCWCAVCQQATFCVLDIRFDKNQAGLLCMTHHKYTWTKQTHTITYHQNSRHRFWRHQNMYVHIKTAHAYESVYEARIQSQQRDTRDVRREIHEHTNITE